MCANHFVFFLILLKTNNSLKMSFGINFHLYKIFRQEEHERMERRERDKQARALMSQQVINAETEPSAAPSLFAAPVRVSYCCFFFIQWFVS